MVAVILETRKSFWRYSIFCIRMPEDIIQKILAVDLGQFLANPVLVGHHDFLDGLDNPNGLTGRGLHPLQHIQEPLLQIPGIANSLEQTVIFRLIVDNITAQVEDRYIKKALGH